MCSLSSSLVLLPSAAMAQVSGQDKAAAETFFNDGVKALEAGQFAAACPKLAESQRLDPAIGTALYLGECYERWGKIASAWAMFHEAQDLATKRNDKRASIAKDRADKLAPSKVVIALAPGADVPGLEIRRDGALVGAVTFGTAIPTDGGAHTIVATAPNRRKWETTLTVPDQGGNLNVTVPKLDEAAATAATDKPPPPVESPPPPPPIGNPPPPSGDTGSTPGGGQRIAGLAVAGAGVASLIVGTAFGAVASSKWAASNAEGRCYSDSTTCLDPSGPGLRSDAFTAATISTVTFIAGGVLVAGGLVLFFTAPKATTTGLLHVTPLVGSQGGGVLLGGRF
jgi:hypothetical protein